MLATVPTRRPLLVCALLGICAFAYVLAPVHLTEAEPTFMEKLGDFMDSQHTELAPTETAADVGNRVEAGVSETLEKIPPIDATKAASAISESLDNAEDALEEFIEEEHDALEPEVTAHEWEEAVFGDGDAEAE